MPRKELPSCTALSSHMTFIETGSFRRNRVFLGSLLCVGFCSGVILKNATLRLLLKLFLASHHLLGSLAISVRQLISGSGRDNGEVKVRLVCL